MSLQRALQAQPLDEGLRKARRNVASLPRLPQLRITQPLQHGGICSSSVWGVGALGNVLGCLLLTVLFLAAELVPWHSLGICSIALERSPAA